MIAMDQGWPVREMACMRLTELMAWVERAAAMLKAGGWR
ncbi:MAG: GpE family phage tail protein [Sphingobacteriia bacterium]|nr:GpE family phage tail protein [Sphingobacteriia bacterium]